MKMLSRCSLKTGFVAKFFLNLSNDELKELMPVIGDRVSEKGIIEKYAR